jgi:hypothetical protein
MSGKRAKGIKMKSNMAQRNSTPQIVFRLLKWNAQPNLYACCDEPCRIRTHFFRFAGIIALAFLATVPLMAQKETPGFPEDWSHHHVVFSRPETLSHASGNGSFIAWHSVLSNPRYTFQRMKQRRQPPFRKWNKKREPHEAPLLRDWSAPLGTAGVAPGMFPAKWTFSTTDTPSCSDFVVFPVNAAGASGSQPNIVAYQNLYVNSGNTGTCPGTAPTVLFSYYVGTGTVQTSPVLGDVVGEVAYVESITGDGASVGSKFHVLTGAGTGSSNGTVAAPVAPGTGNTATDVAITMSGFVSVTRSSPYYDYAHDVAYVGDDSGVLHKFSPVFNGAPAEVTTGGWPATVSTQTGKILTGPVFDNGTSLVYLGDSQGYLYSVSVTGAVVQSGQLGSGTGIVDSPVLDPSAKTLYAFVGDNVGGTGSAVFAFDVSAGITSGGTGSTATLGMQSATVPLYDGTFDNIYYTSSTSAGNLYVCGNAGGNPTLYIVPVSYSSGPVLGSVVTGLALASSNIACSPLTEFYNTSTNTDWLFGSVPSTSCGASGTTAGGCVMSFNITTAATAATPGPWTPSTAYPANAEVVDANGNIQECTGGCGVAGKQSGTTTPSWTTGTTPDGVTANASALGTVSANSATSGATVTIGSLTLTASAPTAARSSVQFLAVPVVNTTLTIKGKTYQWETNVSNCTAGDVCLKPYTTSIAGNAVVLDDNILGTSALCLSGCGIRDPNVTATFTGNTVTLIARTPGTGANSDALATNNTTDIEINGLLGTSSSTLGAGTGTLGTNGSSTPPNFQYWSGSTAVSPSVLASNITAAAAGNSANVTLSYVSGSSFTAMGTGTNAGAAGNSVAIGGTLTGFTWNPTGDLAGGTNPLTWTYQSASNGQTTAPEPTGASGIIIDNDGTGAGEANIYFGTLTGTGATNSAIKMTQSGLQ